MRRKSRYLILALGLMLALSLTVPALGTAAPGSEAMLKSAQSIAKEALKKSKKALKKSKKALKKSDKALTQANTALDVANEALATTDGLPGPPGPAGPAGPAGPGQGFNLILGPSEEKTVDANGFAITGRADDNGDCRGAVLTVNEASVYVENDHSDDDSDAPEGIAAGSANGEELNLIEANDQGLVTVGANDGSGVAQFEYYLDETPGTLNNTCHFVGTAIGG